MIIDEYHSLHRDAITIDGQVYQLHVNVYDSMINSIVIGTTKQGDYLPEEHWKQGVDRVNLLYPDTSRNGENFSPHCNLYIRKEGGSTHIRSREYCLIDLDGPIN